MKILFNISAKGLSHVTAKIYMVGVDFVAIYCAFERFLYDFFGFKTYFILLFVVRENK